MAPAVHHSAKPGTRTPTKITLQRSPEQRLRRVHTGLFLTMPTATVAFAAPPRLERLCRWTT
jgi:hypothetical protein